MGAAADWTVADWARDAYDAVVAVVGVRGSSDPADTVRPGRLTKAYMAAAGAVGESWVRKLAAGRCPARPCPAGGWRRPRPG